MRIIEIINLAMEYNELLVKFTKGSIWFGKPNISEQRKEAFIPKWDNLLKNMDKTLKKLESMGITFEDCEAIECIEIPERFKRKDVEIYLETYYKIEKGYIAQERQGMKLY
jgi:hypothetical protein